jgi:hypothetical protein
MYLAGLPPVASPLGVYNWTYPQRLSQAKPNWFLSDIWSIIEEACRLIGLPRVYSPSMVELDPGLHVSRSIIMDKAKMASLETMLQSTMINEVSQAR